MLSYGLHKINNEKRKKKKSGKHNLLLLIKLLYKMIFSTLQWVIFEEIRNTFTIVQTTNTFGQNTTDIDDI